MTPCDAGPGPPGALCLTRRRVLDETPPTAPRVTDVPPRRDRMKILVVSDIHGNWAALSAVRESYDVCFCLGDLVDYGPEPARCVRWAMANASYAVRGNHDHGAAQGIPVSGETGYRYL